ncbi:hypothetical protein Tco_0937344 [Tanacetum coccineum]|uniref:Uncharacterized protein n=1 Tax=Tanacetum coccineum TaxID=301880 RepID=A0ABQ5DL06_9ASTR
MMRRFLLLSKLTSFQYADELKETNGEKDLEGHYTSAKPLGKALLGMEKDTGSFTLPCFINDMCFNKGLADLGASVIVMPYSTYTTLGLGDLIPTKLIIELADRTVKRPKVIVENVLVGLLESRKLGLETRLMGDELRKTKLQDPNFEDFNEPNYPNEPIEHRRNQVKVFIPTIIGIKSLLDAVRITDAHVYVNAAQLELVLLRDFKENMLSVYYY